MGMDKLIGTAKDPMGEFQSEPSGYPWCPAANISRPDHFIVVSKMTAGSKIQNLHIQNWPTHLFSISGCSDTTMQNLFLDNTAGDAPNARSGGLAAAHNSDGFDLGSSSNFVITDSKVYNQDDCVAVSSGNNVTVSNMYCSGGHGLSIGSVGGKSNNNVTNILVRAPSSSIQTEY
jgi:polygalacturonase